MMSKRLPVTPAPGPLEAFARAFDELFSKRNQRELFRRYQGPLLPSERNKTLTGLANTGPVVDSTHPEAQTLQWFLSESSWDPAVVNNRRLALLQGDAMTAATNKGARVIDETGERKWGNKTAQVGRQYPGSIGKVDRGVVDQVGFSLALKPIKTWTPKGSGIQFEMPSRQGSAGRLNLIGALDFAADKLFYRDLAGSCDASKCETFLDRLAEQADPEGLTIVVLDNARFHKAKNIQAKEPLWPAKGFFVPPYSPQLNPIEAFWRVLKGFLLPGRLYASLNDLKQAVFSVLTTLGAISG